MNTEDNLPEHEKSIIADRTTCSEACFCSGPEVGQKLCPCARRKLTEYFVEKTVEFISPSIKQSDWYGEWKPTELAIGQCWFVKMNGARALTQVWITDITDKTIQLKSGKYDNYPSRYEKKDITFVELVDESK